MSDLDKNIYRKEEPSPYEKIIVNPIEQDKKEREGYSSLKNATRSQVFAALVSFFNKFLTIFSSKGKGESVFDLKHLIDNLKSFRQQLIILSLEDQSHNPDFTLHLSELWHTLLDDCNSLSLAADTSEILTKLKFFISQLQQFPTRRGPYPWLLFYGICRQRLDPLSFYGIAATSARRVSSQPRDQRAQ